jgi:hypothetical protein
MARSALENSARQIRKKYVPLLIEHDFDRQVGVLLNAKVAKLPDGEYGLFAVAGEFENEGEKIAYKSGERNTVHKKYSEELKGIEATVSLTSAESLEATPAPRNLNIAEQLAIHLDSIKVLDTGEVYKIKRYIASAGDLEIHVYPKDHPNENPGHFHITSKQRKIDARFNIDTLKFLSNKKGSLTNNDLKKITNFFESHPAALKSLRKEYHRLNA